MDKFKKGISKKNRFNQCEKSRRFRKIIIIWLGLLSFGLMLGMILNHFDLYLPCLFREVTGFKCPGCGVTRMSMAIMRMDFKEAFYYNPVVFLMLPVIFIILVNMSISYVKNATLNIGKVLNIVATLMIVILLIFGIARNIV